MKPLKTMMLPLSIHDETTTIGTAKVLVNFLKSFSIVKIVSSGLDHITLELGEEHETKNIMMVGDGIAFIRSKCFQDF